MVGATPDGRHANEVLADSMGSSQGMDRNGPTALMNSVNLVQAGKYFLTTPVLNLRGLIEGYFRGGGMQLQINVCDAEVLKAAVKEPEKYRSLVVRVGGYSDYFVNLSTKLQQEIIQRTEHII